MTLKDVFDLAAFIGKILMFMLVVIGILEAINIFGLKLLVTLVSFVAGICIGCALIEMGTKIWKKLKS